jgi:ATP-dependent exoDNAse (exonuclease V) beta subunit
MKNVTYISAGAGSGKTYTLTTKLAELISKDRTDPEHVEPEQVILTTFTVKAANEFKEKAKAELYKKGKFDEASRLDNALMGTIDSVASTLIQKYWYAIGMSPKQGVMDESAKETYINQSIANIPTDDDLHFFAKFRKAFNITDKDAHPNENYWKDHLKDIVEKSISFDITDYQQSVDESLRIIKGLCNGTHIHIDVRQRIAVLEAFHTEVEGCKESGKKVTTLNAIDTLQKSSRYMDDIEWYSELGQILKGAPAVPKNAVPFPILEDAKQKAVDLWRSQEVYDLQEEYIKTIFRLAKQWNEQYTQYKLNKRIVDFSDIEHYMHKLLQDKEVAAEIGRTYTHLFVDEFQDCSPIQVKIFMTLADVVKKSYWVGDTKQAIYGFRGSDTQLTKAVADAISQGKGNQDCQSETLKESWRSVPSIVKACNKAFTSIFHPIFEERTEELVPLKSAMEEHPEQFKVELKDRAKNPLRYLDITERRSPRSPKLSVDDVAQYIKNVIENEDVKPSDIAVLGRAGFDLDDVQAALNAIGVECDRETTLDKESKACQLMMALTTLTINPQDDLAKAEIAYMTQDNMGVGAIIDSKLVYNNMPKEERLPWLGETEMISRVNSLRPRVMYQGIGALMETLAVELDVKNVMERWSSPIEQSMIAVKALIAAAKQYEERSSELAQPATPAGFREFLDENDIKLPITGNGVQLLTYHGAKGLEWKYVFVLLDETLEPKDVLRRELYGIHHFHPQLPSADNLYPQMSIRLMPWIFGSRNSNVPESIAQLLFASEDYTKLNQHCLEESARLLYVGMTRAAEVLVLVPWFAKKEFHWLIRSGLPTAGNIDGGDVLGVGAPFKIVHAVFPDEDDVEMMPEPKVYHKLDYHSDKPSDATLRSVVPSGLKGKSDDVEVVYRSEQFIKIDSGKLHGRTYSEVGDCIHNVYAAIEHLDDNEVEQLISSHGMDDVLPNTDEVIRAWRNLQTFLAKEYGEPTAVYHERPFRSLQKNGTMVVGSIDCVYQTPHGDVLIDFKTFPQVEAVTDPTSNHYAGLYAGQMDAYTDALEAAGEKVMKRLIYYPVSGLVVEIGKSE